MSERSAIGGWMALDGPAPVVLVTAVGAASGARAAAAALACVASEPDRAALLIDFDDGRPPRPSLIATAGARKLEERLVAHLPEVPVASRGCICHLKLPVDVGATEQLAAALPLVRDSAAAVNSPPQLLQPLLAESRLQPTAALLRADLTTDRALTALAVRDLMARSLRVVVLKYPLRWLNARASLLGVALPGAGGALPIRLCNRLLSVEDNKFRQCYDRKYEASDGLQTNVGIDR